ncbi:HNH endonuclease [Agromyces sp. MMS24-JH15]|uniref:HNH endonuclease n=1 Tax=Agromyces sp. MMS24-JH15 TaxID=3243765 RepID=UPI00374A0D95
MVRVEERAEGDTDLYVDALAAVASGLAASQSSLAAERLQPIAGRIWHGRLSRPRSKDGASTDGAPRGIAMRGRERDVTPRKRAEVFIRDGFCCAYCGGRVIPLPVLVAISDVFPEGLPYHAYYKSGHIHPAFWFVAPEVDHVLAHASGGTGELENLATLHSACNAMKADVPITDLPPVERAKRVDGWDGLLSLYPGVVAAGETYGTRHHAARYHTDWLRYFGL